MSGSPSISTERRHRRLQRRMKREIANWGRGTTCDARRFIEAHPQILADPLLMVDLANAEYCFKRDAGESLDLDKFAKGFPEIEQELRRQIFVDFVSQDIALDEKPPESDIAWPQSGERFHDLEIVGELGRGGFSRVYLAREPSVGDRQLAVKICRNGSHEAFTLGSLDHPHIVPVHAVHEDEEGTTRILMPFLGRATLADVVAHTSSASQQCSASTILQTVARVNDPAPRREVDPQELAGFERLDYVEGILRILEGVADALCYLHSRGMRHYDLKPSNVLLTREGVPLLADFNLARDATQSTLRVGGTLPYMSPEQLKLATGTAEPGTRTDERSDIFSLGLLMYELFTGSLPKQWCCSIPDAFTRRELAEETIELRQRRPKVHWPPTTLCGFGIRDLVERCLAEDPNDRPQSMAEVLRAIRGERSLPTRWVRAARSRPRLTATVLLAAFLAMFAWLAYSRAREPRHLRDVEQARELVSRGEYGEARQLLDQIVEREPQLGSALKLRLQVNIQLKEFDAALRDAKLIYLLSDPGRFHAIRGYLRGEMGNTGASQDYSKAIELGYRQSWVYNNLAADRARFEYVSAVRALRRAAQVSASPEQDRVLARNRLRLAQFECVVRRGSHEPFVALHQRVEDEGGELTERDRLVELRCCHGITPEAEQHAEECLNVCLNCRPRVAISRMIVMSPAFD